MSASPSMKTFYVKVISYRHRVIRGSDMNDNRPNILMGKGCVNKGYGNRMIR